MLSRGLRLARAERWLALEALAVLALARLLFATLPFRTAMACFALRQKPAGGAEACASASNEASIAAIATAVRRGSRVAPFRAVCLQQSVAAALMLRRRGLPAEIHFGVAKPRDGALLAHAWSICGRVVVTGKDGMELYTPLAVFSA